MRISSLVFALTFCLGIVGYAIAEDGGKNLKVLPKTMSKVEIKKVMKAMSASLGVECDHCHNTEDMAVDTKHKLEAREMMVMVNDINKRYFKGEMEVTCKTCHRGQHEPSE